MCPGTTSYVNLNKLSQEQNIKDILLELSELNLNELYDQYLQIHELNDRNAGPGPNHLLIRTTCFRKFEFSNEPITAYNGTHWKEGYANVGAGLTWGRNFWWDLENSVGVYPLAAKHDREAVGGTCHSGNHYYK